MVVLSVSRTKPPKRRVVYSYTTIIFIFLSMYSFFVPVCDDMNVNHDFSYSTEQNDIVEFPEDPVIPTPKKEHNNGFFNYFRKKLGKKYPTIIKNSIHLFLSSCPNSKEVSHDPQIQLTMANCSAFDPNSCYEVPYILDFIIQNYDSFTAENIVFMQDFTPSNHSFSNVYPKLLDIANSNYFNREVFGGFPSCDWEKGCSNIFYADIYCYIYNDTTVSPIWDRHSSFPSHSTFFVKTSQIRKRPKQDYATVLQNLRKWLKLNSNVPQHCSNTFRATWHILFGGLQYINPPKENVNWLVNSDKKCTFIDFINKTNAWTR